MKQSAIATMIERDLLRDDDSAPRSVFEVCFACGRGMVYRGSRFCSDGCRDFYDSGAPGHHQDWLRRRSLADTPLRDLRVVAGPPGVEIGSSYYGAIFDARDPQFRQRQDGRVVMKPTKAGFKIKCAHCQAEFESKGLRCCSARCEAEFRKPASTRKRRRPNIPYYSIKASGHGHWQPGKELRACGFASVDCGFDGPEAWAKAEQLNGEARQTRAAAAA